MRVEFLDDLGGLANDTQIFAVVTKNETKDEKHGGVWEFSLFVELAKSTSSKHAENDEEHDCRASVRRMQIVLHCLSLKLIVIINCLCNCNYEC